MPPQTAEATPIYLYDDEALLEISNKTIHALVHLGWVPLGDDGHRTVELAVYIKSRGVFSDAYMMLIAPLRHLVVYPALLARLRRRWEERRAASR